MPEAGPTKESESIETVLPVPTNLFANEPVASAAATESPARIPPSVMPVTLIEAMAAGVPATLLGYSGGDSLVVEGLFALPLAELRAVHEAWLPTYMNSAA